MQPIKFRERRWVYVAWISPFAVCLLVSYAYALALIIGLPILGAINLVQDLLARCF